MPNKAPELISYNTISQLVTDSLSKKAVRYGIRVCSNLDALVYVNLRHKVLETTVGIANLDGLIAQGWRSVSFIKAPSSYVFFAQDNAPDFLKSNKGLKKKEWDGPCQPFELEE